MKHASLTASSIIACIILFSHIPLSFSFMQFENQIYDLESTDEIGFAIEASYWNATSLVDGQTKFSFCYDKYIMGGYNILGFNGAYFSRIYTGLPNHNMLHMSIDLQPIDSWDGTSAGDHVQIMFDSVLFDTWKLDFVGTLPKQLCGSTSFNEFPPITALFDVIHSGSNLTLEFISHFNQVSTDESFGFRDIVITFYNSTTLVNQYCGQANNSLPNNWCACPSSQHYQDPVNSGTCLPCDTTCNSCTGPLATQCVTCGAGMYFHSNQCLNCDPTCATCTGSAANKCLTCPTASFLLNNNTCTDCPYPMVQSTNGTINFCSYPCIPNPYILWDRTCSSSCDSPLVQETPFYAATFCTYPCEPYEYLYWNGSCLLTCDFPLNQSVKHDRNFCNYPCSGSNYLYWNGSCLPSCDSPLVKRVEASQNYCDLPCPLPEYLYWNGSCISSCNFPFKINTTSIVPQCGFPCLDTEIVYWDGTCQTTCDLPLSPRTEGTTPPLNFCDYPCQLGEFLYWNGTCSSICIPPLTNSYLHQRSLCHYPCLSTEYLHWDGTCQTSCDPPLVTRPEAGLNYCDFPCYSDEYLFWNGSCISQCNSPLVIRTQGPAQFCYYPCDDTNDFLYWNGTCSSQCSSPLLQKIEGTPARKYCNLQCELTEYYTAYGTCTATCDFPLTTRIENEFKYCDYSCSSSQYLYWNGSCFPNCDFPLVQRIENGQNFCDFPCVSSSELLNWDGECTLKCRGSSIFSEEGTGSYMRGFCLYGCSSSQYLYWNESCLDSCLSPFRQQVEGNRNLCLDPCVDPADYYYEDLKICNPECHAPYSINDEGPYLMCIAPPEEDGWIVTHILTSSTEPTKVTVVTLVKIMEYIRYLDITMPPRLQRLAMSKARNILSLKLGYGMSEQMEEFFPSNNLPYVFEKHGISSSFLVNYWQELTSLGILTLLAIVVVVGESLSKVNDWKPWCFIFERLRGLLKWNALLIVIATNIDEVILYSYLQFYAFMDSSSSSFTIIGFFVSLVALTLVIAFLGFTFYLIIKKNTSTQDNFKQKMYSHFIIKWRDFQVLFQSFNETSFLNQWFYLIYIFRVCLPIFIASYFYRWPLPQMILQLLISISIIIYLFYLKPIKKKINHIQLVLFETITLIMNICMLTITCLDVSNTNQWNLSIVLGDIVILGNVAINTLLVIFLLIKLLLEGKQIFSSIKTSSAQERAAWIQLLVVPIQQAGLGFEEIRWIEDEVEINDNIQESKDQENLVEFNKSSIQLTEEVIMVREDTVIDRFGEESERIEDIRDDDIEEGNKSRADMEPKRLFEVENDLLAGPKIEHSVSTCALDRDRKKSQMPVESRGTKSAANLTLVE